jgi:hypothetical protein
MLCLYALRQFGIFAASRDEVHTVLWGWRFPWPLLAEPIEKRGINPFTKQPFTYRTRVPDPPPAPRSAAVSPELTKFRAFKEAPTSCGTCLQPFFPGELGVRLGLWSEDERDERARFLVGPEGTKHWIELWPAELTLELSGLDKQKSGRLIQSIEQSIEDELAESGERDPWRRRWLDALVAMAGHAVDTRREMYDFFVDDL